MATLRISGEETNNVLALHGHKENDFSLAIAWSLASCSEFLSRVLSSLLSWHGSVSLVEIDVHRHHKGMGITDIEVLSPGHFHLIVEAKLGIALPGASQLRKYAARLHAASEPITFIVTLSECPPVYADSYSPKEVDGIGVRHMTWDQVLGIAAAATPRSNHTAKRTLRDLGRFLRRYRIMQDINSNLVFVVSLRTSRQTGWQISWVDVEAKYNRYFHPLAKNWPRQPPNYVAFRYGGKLQSIHHIEKSEVIRDLADACPGIPQTPVEPHYLYYLGPAMRPDHEVKTGALYPNARVWCHLDTLLTCDSVYDALQATKRRLKKADDGQ